MATEINFTPAQQAQYSEPWLYGRLNVHTGWQWRIDDDDRVWGIYLMSTPIHARQGMSAMTADEAMTWLNAEDAALVDPWGGLDDEDAEPLEPARCAPRSCPPCEA